MKIKVKLEDTFIPKWNDNEKEETPVEVDLKYLTTGELDDCINDSGIPDKRKICKTALKEIRNLEINGKPVKTFEQMMEIPGLVPLYYEIVAHVARMEAIENSKN